MPRTDCDDARVKSHSHDAQSGMQRRTASQSVRSPHDLKGDIAETFPSRVYWFVEDSPNEGGSSPAPGPEGKGQRIVPKPFARRRASRVRPDMRLAELLDAWEEGRNPSAKTRDGANRAVAQFRELFGDIAVSEIVADDLFDYRDMVAALPRTLSSDERAEGFARLAVRFSNSKDSRARVALSTVRKQLRYIQALLVFAFRERWITENVGRDIPAVGQAGRSERRAFTRDEVGAIFALPIFVKPWSSEPHHQISNDTLRWLLLIALTSGARLEEIGQLQPEDIRTDGDIAYMVIDDVDALGTRCHSKSIKNPSARRRVPLHSDLLKLGLQGRAARLGQEGAEQLFPDLHIDAFGHYTSNASRCCNRLSDKVTRDPRVVFHSLRHFFKDQCREAGMLESVSDQLTGHAPTSVGGRYGSGVSLTELKSQLERLRFEFVDWARIYAASRL